MTLLAPLLLNNAGSGQRERRWAWSRMRAARRLRKRKMQVGRVVPFMRRARVVSWVDLTSGATITVSVDAVLDIGSQAGFYCQLWQRF